MLFRAAQPLLAREATGPAFRLIGIGAQPLVAGREADLPDLADPDAGKRAAKWSAVEALRKKFGAAAIVSGRGLPPMRCYPANMVLTCGPKGRAAECPPPPVRRKPSRRMPAPALDTKSHWS